MAHEVGVELALAVDEREERAQVGVVVLRGDDAIQDGARVAAHDLRRHVGIPAAAFAGTAAPGVGGGPAWPWASGGTHFVVRVSEAPSPAGTAMYSARAWIWASFDRLGRSRERGRAASGRRPERAG